MDTPPTQYKTLMVKPGITVDFASVVIEGPRVLLAPVANSHAGEIFREFTPEITRYMFPKPADTVEEVAEIIAIFSGARKKREEIVSAILHRETGEFLGCCGLHAREMDRAPELGIWVKKGAHGNHYGREAIYTLVSWAKENLTVDGFLYPVDKRNIPSRKIPESLGGDVIAEKLVTSQAGNILDEVVYRISA